MAWNLPAPIRPYSLSDQLPIKRTEMESGPARVKRTSSDYTTFISVRVYLTDAQLDEYRTHLEGEANFGASWFEMPIITRGNLVTHLVRIMSSDLERTGQGWMLSMQLETREHNN